MVKPWGLTICSILTNKYHLYQEVKPKIHLFGHVHESYGVIEKRGVKFVNASILNEKYEVVNHPISFQW